MCYTLFYSPRTADAWDFAHQDITQAIGILSFGKIIVILWYIYTNLFVEF